MKLRGLLTLLVGALLLGVGCTTDADINTSGAGSEGKIKTVKITAMATDGSNKKKTIKIKIK